MEKSDFSKYADITHILGNDDFRSGANILMSLSARLNHARHKHKWGKGKEIDSFQKAFKALCGETQEWLDAMENESQERQFSEAIDILAVAIRIANREFED